VEVPRDDRLSRRDGEAAGSKLVVHINEDGVAAASTPIASGSPLHTQVMKTEALKQALDKYGFDAAFGGARRDEEKSRAKERIFSFRTAATSGTRATSGPNCGGCTTRASSPANPCACSRCRTGPSSTSGNTSDGGYPVVPLYFAKPRPVVERDGMR
jgi:sulfate adenylyltransferase subunit 2